MYENTREPWGYDFQIMIYYVLKICFDLANSEDPNEMWQSATISDNLRHFICGFTVYGFQHTKG